jgi:hypothetical protein
MTNYTKLKAYLNRILEIAQEDSSSEISLGVIPAARSALNELDSLDNSASIEVGNNQSEKHLILNLEQAWMLAAMTTLGGGFPHEAIERIDCHLYLDKSIREALTDALVQHRAKVKIELKNAGIIPGEDVERNVLEIFKALS